MFIRVQKLVTNFLAAAASNAAGMSKKFSAFSLKEIDRSLLLEDFLRKSENVYSGDF